MNKFLFSVSMVLLAACSNPLGGGKSVVDQGHTPGVENGPESTPAHAPGYTTAFVSSSQQNKTTSRNYKISQSVGELTKDVKVTTARGYIFYSNIQGNLISDAQ